MHNGSVLCRKLHVSFYIFIMDVRLYFHQLSAIVLLSFMYYVYNTLCIIMFLCSVRFLNRGALLYMIQHVKDKILHEEFIARWMDG